MLLFNKLALLFAGVRLREPKELLCAVDNNS